MAHWFGLVAVAGCALIVACQREEEHPAYAAGCETDCKPAQGISVGTGSQTPVTTPESDAGFDAGNLTGNVILLSDATFAVGTPFTSAATVSADGASGAAVTGTWDGTNPYVLTGVAVGSTNWVGVQPAAAQGDALLTYQAVQTNTTSFANLALVNGPTLQQIFTSISSPYAPEAGQVVLFFHSSGTSTALSGVRATIANKSQVIAYAASSGWVVDDGTTTTNSSGLMLFGNVDLPVAGTTTQIVTVNRPATATMAAVPGGTFTVRVVAGAVTIANVNVQL